MGGPIKAVERIQSEEIIENDPSDMQVFNVEVSVESQNDGDEVGDEAHAGEDNTWIDPSEVVEQDTEGDEQQSQGDVVSGNRQLHLQLNYSINKLLMYWQVFLML